MHLHNYFQTIHWALLQTFYQSNWIWKVNGRLQLQKIPTHQCTKMSRREKLFFLTRNFQSRQNSTIWNLAFSRPLRILLKPWTLSFKKNTIIARTVSQLKCLKKLKKSRFTLQMKDLILRSLVRIWDPFSKEMLVINSEYCWEEKDLTNQKLLTTLSANTLSWCTQTWLSTISWATRRLHSCVAFFCFEAQVSRHYNYWTTHELSDFYQPAIQITAQKLFS